MALQIQLSQGKVALVSPEDYEAVSAYTWYADYAGNTWYAATRVNGKKTYLHRFVMQAGSGELVDHVDCDGLNCQRGNLRFLSKSANTIRRGAISKTGFKGVTFDKSRNRFMAKHCADSRGVVFLGRYVTAEEAARAYDAYARKYLGPLAFTNFEL